MIILPAKVFLLSVCCVALFNVLFSIGQHPTLKSLTRTECFEEKPKVNNNSLIIKVFLKIKKHEYVIIVKI